MNITVIDFLLALGINLSWFLIVFWINFDVFNDCRKYSNKSYLSYDYFEPIEWIGGFFCLVCGIASFFGFIAYLASNSFSKDNILLFFMIATICILIIVFMRIIIKHNLWYKNIQRKKNIENKIYTIEKQIENYKKALKDFSISSRERETYTAFVSVLTDMHEELKLMLVSVDISLTVEAVKDIPMQPNTLKNLEKEVEKIKAYHSLDEINMNIQSLMKKYDTKK